MALTQHPRPVAAMAISGLLLLATPTLLAPVCDKLIELKNGNLTYMRCHYTQQATLIMAGLVLLLAIVALFQERTTLRAMGWLLAGMGLAVALVPVVIGVCKSPTMPCRETAVWLYAEGGLMMVVGLLTALTRSAMRANQAS